MTRTKQQLTLFLKAYHTTKHIKGPDRHVWSREWANLMREYFPEQAARKLWSIWLHQSRRKVKTTILERRNTNTTLCTDDDSSTFQAMFQETLQLIDEQEDEAEALEEDPNVENAA
eukprot:3548617-Rhodomonas_salina.1